MKVKKINHITDSALTKRVSRREVLGSLASAGFMAVGGSSLLLSPEVRAEIRTPQYGGHARVAMHSSSTKDTLDPARASTAIDYCRDFMFYNGLTEFDDQLMPQPSLAESFYDVENGRRWVFKLRRGVTFHNGKNFTPSDVVFSIMRHKDPKVGSTIKSLINNVSHVEISGNNEVTVYLKIADTEFASITSIYQMLIVPSGTTDFSKGVGTGPFKCQEFNPGIRAVAVKNNNYWKFNKPYLDSIETTGIENSASRLNALLSGTVDIIDNIDFNSAGQVKKSHNTKLYEINAGGYTDLVMRLDMPPGDHPAFVEGMKYLLNRDLIKENIFNGYAVIANDQPIPPNNPYYFDGLPQRQFDPDRAKFLFKKAGISGNKLTLIASNAAIKSVDMAVILQQSAMQAGLNIEVKRTPSAGYWSNYWAKRPITFGFINGRPTAAMRLRQFFYSDAPWNESKWNNSEFDKLLNAVRKESDFNKRKIMYAQMQRLIYESSGIGIPVFVKELCGYNSKIMGVDAYKIPLSGFMGNRFAENIWWSK